MEEHLEHHGNERPFKCSICDKGFYLKWRMEKHTSDHRVDIKFCHYYNNDKPCPYDKVGYKFISTDRTIAHREFRKHMDNAEAVEMNVKNYYGVFGSESFLADMESMEGVVDEDSEDNESFLGGVEENYETQDSDDESSEEEDELRRIMHKMLTAWV